MVAGLADEILSVNRAIDAGASVVFGPEASYVEWADGPADGSHADVRRTAAPARYWMLFGDVYA